MHACDVGLKPKPVNYELTETALKVLCNVVSHDMFHTVLARGNDNVFFMLKKFFLMPCCKIRNNFFARKQLLLPARLSHRNSVCPSISPSHGWISQK